MYLFTYVVDVYCGILLSIHRCPVSHCGNNPGRIKRVLLCKRRSHHLLACRMPVRRPSIASTKDSKLMCDGQREAFVSEPCEVPDDKNGTGETDFEEDDCFIFDEVWHTLTAEIMLCSVVCPTVTMFFSSQGITAQCWACSLKDIWDWKCLQCFGREILESFWHTWKGRSKE